MKRDYSQFLPLTTKNGTTGQEPTFLQKLGWQAFYIQQLTPEERERYRPARVCEVHRINVRLLGDGLETTIPLQADMAVGDWVLYDDTSDTLNRVLARKSLMKRRNAGTERKIQNIAANMDTVFIVTSCNHDFNPARLERYIALAFEAEVTPVIILTKADLCDNADDYLQQALSISPTVFALTLNAHDTDVKRLLADWCGIGQSVAFLGSSGVGKSTLVNQLRGDHVVETQSIREQDSKGRHTTTSRQLHLLADGFVVIDTPGMRELQMSDVASGIAQLFDDLQTLSETCRFADCVHESEPGCAIQQGVTSGEIDPKRVARWQKLAREEAFNTASLAERRSKDKAFGKMVRRVIKDKKKTRS